jgi:hypothetical protein
MKCVRDDEFFFFFLFLLQLNGTTVPLHLSNPVFALICDKTIFKIEPLGNEIYHIAKSFRIVHCPHPDVKAISRAYLEAAGLAQAQAQGSASKISKAVAFYNSCHPQYPPYSSDVTSRLLTRLMRGILVESWAFVGAQQATANLHKRFR